MAGKAIVHGYVPYIDFIDVKGPLLFLFFALGYAVGGFHGIAVLFVATLFLTLSAFYKTARLYITNQGFCVLAAIFPIFFLLCPAFESHGRAEEVVLPFLAWAIYLCLRYIKEQESTKHLAVASCFLGICGAVSFFIKYNIALPFLILWLYVYICACSHNKKQACTCFAACSLGFCVVSIPTIAYLTYTGSLIAFYDVYFLLNFETYDNFRHTCSIENKFLSFFFRCIGCPLSILCLFTKPFKTEETLTLFSDRVLLFITAVALLLCCVLGWAYYYLIALPVILLAGMTILYPMAQLYPHFNSIIALLLTPPLVVTFLSLTHDAERGLKKIFQGHPDKFYLLDNIINQQHQPKLLYLNFLDLGLGVKSEALPACPAWFHLNGAPKDFEAQQVEAIKAGIPDFVITTSVKFVEDNGQKFPQSQWLQDHHYAHVLDQEGLGLYQKVSNNQ